MDIVPKENDEEDRMKIKVKEISLSSVYGIKMPKHPIPKKPNIFFRTLVRLAAIPELSETDFTVNKTGMEKLGKNEPCLFLMNHSCFLDLKIASAVLYPRPYQIICTQDGFVGKEWLMRNLGCIPKKKLVSDFTVIRDMLYCFKKLKTSVLMYPEASYSFDGTATPLPESLGKCLKLLGVPVVMIRTYGAFGHDPLYNGLQLRKTKVSADVRYLFSAEDVKTKSAAELNAVLKSEFTIDNFRWQQENRVKIDEPFRADHLNRVLYKCPHCNAEGMTEGVGDKLICHNCNKTYTLDEYGCLRAEDGIFDHIPDWYAWERECVKKELQDGTYKTECDVDICVLADYKCIYKVGTGHLVHDCDGFFLMGCDGRLEYRQGITASYGLYSDYYWYEIGDMICLGNNGLMFYCFPKNAGDIVAKARIATEELYKIGIKRLKEKAPS